MSRFGKSYGTMEEFEYRFSLFQAAQVTIKQKNARNGITYRLGTNKFADWTKEEYRRLLTYKKNPTFQGYTSSVRVLSENDVPRAVDWRDHNAVNYV